MPVDEFGREVPSLFAGLGGNTNLRPAEVAASIRRSSPSSVQQHHQQKQYHHQAQHQRQGHSNASNRNHYGQSSSSHYHSSGSGIYGPQQTQHHSGSYHNNSSANSLQTAGRSHYLSAPVASLTPVANNASNLSSGGAQSSSSNSQGLKPPTVETEMQPPPHKAHPSLSYVSEPMLCEYVWKESEVAVEALKAEKDLTDEKYEAPLADNPGKVESEKEDEQEDGTAKRQDAKVSKLYEKYRKNYCLHYIRSFFNKHLDDSWFRQRFSPLTRKQAIYDLERDRAIYEATEFYRVAADLGSEFLKDIRLGNGLKPQHLSQPLMSPRKGNDNNYATSVTQSNQQYTNKNLNSPPLNHLFSFQKISLQKQTTASSDKSQSNSTVKVTATEMFALHVLDVPSYVTDEHVALALVDQCNITIQAKHEQQQSQQLADTQASHNGGNDGNSSNNASSVPKKSSSNPVNVVAPNLLRLSEIKIYPAPATLISDGPPTVAMHRQVLAVGPAAAMTEIIVSVKARHDAKASASTPSNEASSNSATGKRSVPRKVGGIDEMNIRTHPEAFYGPFDMEVECSDPYGRIDIDADGRGSAPADGQTVPPRKAVVGVSPVHAYVGASTSTNLASANLRKPQYAAPQYQQRPLQHPFEISVVVLSAAVSSKARIEADKISALKLAEALDAKKRVPKEMRLDNLIEQHFANETVEDLLDLSIAYLRRIHLLSFYNGCTEAETIGDVMAGKHPCSTIHLRLQNADDYIQKSEEETKQAITTDSTATIEDDEGSKDTNEVVTESSKLDLREEKPVVSKDMLVQRLDDSISRALDKCSKWLDVDDVDEQDVPGMIDEQTERDAKCIEDATEDTKGKWIDDHCIIDADGRARCSFHFCHKLFKDSSFLEKHLLKKHAEFLRADQASCHDEYMMAEWDSCSSRPVPPILVDCGSHFGCVSANIITGQTEPDVVDPEPALWRQHEEKRQWEQEMERKREELRQQQYNNNQNHYPHKDSNGNKDFGENNRETSPAITGRQQRSAFVDVDDMKVEKVELSFDAVEVDDVAASVLLANKKKKKKKKLL